MNSEITIAVEHKDVSIGVEHNVTVVEEKSLQPTAAHLINAHNTDADAHKDIREHIEQIVQDAPAIDPASGNWFVAGKDTGVNAHGIQGPKGDKGDKGNTGAQGPQGIQGEQGPVGATGAQGPAGAKGEKGDKGEPGEKGDTGAQGPQGIPGEKGDKGEPGADGAPGAAGPKGDTGPAGPQGEQGPKGDPGATGPQGEKGEKGDKGDTGATGATGAAGTSAGFGTPMAYAYSMPAGTSPSVMVNASGSNTSKVFSFTFYIPQGAKGDKGDPGEGASFDMQFCTVTAVDTTSKTATVTGADGMSYTLNYDKAGA